jgi:2-C-methyl-D-erythritol 4-phosphate cytidylyltransferase
VIDRNNLRIIQTPQTFKSDILLRAFAVEDEEKFTDEATVVETSGTRIHLIEGELTNIKITRPIDIVIAEKILDQRYR